MTVESLRPDPAPPPGGGPPELELKYVFPNPLAPVLVRWLRGTCRPDPEFPEGVVASIYFDDWACSLLEEKRNSDYFKSKVRLRWYRRPDGTPGDGSVYLETKSREGGTRRKERLPTGFSVRRLEGTDLWSRELLAVNAMPGIEGIRRTGPLIPVLQIEYVRHRFVEPLTGARISVDRDIRAPRVNPQRATGPAAAALREGVLEVKGPHPRLPDRLAAVGGYGCRKRSFSKYQACCEKIFPRSP